jgi:hypothetical protein
MFALVEGWNELLGFRSSSVAIPCPWRHTLYNWVGYTQCWNMFSVDDTIVARSTKVQRVYSISKIGTVLRLESGELIDAETGGPFDSPRTWIDSFTSVDLRDAWLGKSCVAGYDSDSWMQLLAVYFSSQARQNRKANVVEAIFFERFTQVSLPTDQTRSMASVNPALRLWVRPVGTVQLTGSFAGPLTRVREAPWSCIDESPPLE